MRILVQRVFQSWVKVADIQISRTGEGLLVLLGITHDDNSDVADHMVSKILNMRLWQSQGKTWNASVMQIKGQVMIVSQFTLYGILKGNKPDFHASMQADKARELFDYVVQQLKIKYNEQKIQTGKFQALMEVGSVINGPVTVQYQKSSIDMPKKKPIKVVNGNNQKTIVDAEQKTQSQSKQMQKMQKKEQQK